MKAALLKAFGAPLVVEEVADPEPGPDDVVVRVFASGIDGTDLKLLDGFGYTPELPFIMGHESAGTIESAGSRVKRWKPGDRVVPYNFVIEPEDPWYRTEREQLCQNLAGILGVRGANGGYAELLCVPARQLIPIPHGIAFADAAVHCDAGLTALHAVRRARLAPGETALVIGVGGVGAFAVQFACIAGARVIAVEKTEAKRDWARQLGAAAAMSGADIARTIPDLTGGRGVDCALDIVGTRDSMQGCIEAVMPGGRIVIVGYTPDWFSISGKKLAQNELEMIGARAGSRQELAQALALTAAGRVRSIVTDTAALADVNDALARLRSGLVLGRLVLDCASGRA